MTHIRLAWKQPQTCCNLQHTESFSCSKFCCWVGHCTSSHVLSSTEWVGQAALLLCCTTWADHGWVNTTNPGQQFQQVRQNILTLDFRYGGGGGRCHSIKGDLIRLMKIVSCKRGQETAFFVWLGSNRWAKFRYLFLLPLCNRVVFLAWADKTLISWAFLQSQNHTQRTCFCLDLWGQRTRLMKIKDSFQQLRHGVFLTVTVILSQSVWCFCHRIRKEVGKKKIFSDVIGWTISLHYTAI